MARRASDGSARGNRSPAEEAAAAAAGSGLPRQRPVLPPLPEPAPEPRSARRASRMARTGVGRRRADVRRGVYPRLPLVHNVTGAAGDGRKEGGGGKVRGYYADACAGKGRTWWSH